MSRSTDGVFAPRYRVVSAAIVLTVTIFAFEGMAISTAMPVAGAELGAARGYGLAFSVLVTLQVLGTVLAGPWCDTSGPLPVVIAGQLLFAVGAAACAAATAYPVFLLGRAFAGLGTGLSVVALYVIIGRFYPASLRPAVFTYVSAAWVLPSLLGPSVAAWLTESFSWRWVFGIVCVPAVAAAAVVASRARSVEMGYADPARTPGGLEDGLVDGMVAVDGVDAVDGMDAVGAADPAGRAAHLRTAAIGIGVAAAAGVVQYGAAQLRSVVSAAGAAILVGVVAILLTAPRVLTPGTLTMRRGLASVMTARLLLMAAFNGVVSFVPLMLTAERGASLPIVGVALTVGSLGWFAGAWVQGRSRWTGRRWQLVAGGGVGLSAGLLLCVLVAATSLPWPALAAGQLLAGLGMGLATASTGVLALELAPVSDHGAASSSLQLSDSLGSIIGLSTASAVYAALHVSPGADGGVYVVMWSALVMLALLVVAAGVRARVVRG